MVDNPNICYYCGEIADGVDRVFPRNAIARVDVIDPHDIKNRILIVGCCRDCNSRLGGHWFNTLAERKAFLKRLLKHKYRKLLTIPDWTEEEITELGYNLADLIGYNLADLIRKTMANKKRIKQRIAF